MKHLIAAFAVVIITFLVPAPAEALVYSQNSRISATLSPVRHCSGEYTVYEVALRNSTDAARYFRSFEVRRGLVLSDSRWRVPRRTTTGLMFYVPSGRRTTITVTYRSEVILHRRLSGICY